MSVMDRVHDFDSWQEWEPCNNDDDPTPEDDWDYSPWWDNGPTYWEPHPDMEGRTCSTGFRHVRREIKPRGLVGLARIII